MNIDRPRRLKRIRNFTPARGIVAQLVRDRSVSVGPSGSCGG